MTARIRNSCQSPENAPVCILASSSNTRLVNTGVHIVWNLYPYQNLEFSKKLPFQVFFIGLRHWHGF